MRHLKEGGDLRVDRFLMLSSAADPFGSEPTNPQKGVTIVDDRIISLHKALEKCCRLTTTPVAVKLVSEDKPPPDRAKVPLEHIGNRMAVCQGMTLARTLGWVMVYRKEDHACPFPRVFMGHVPPDRFLEGMVADMYVEDPDRMLAMEASYPRWPAGAFREIWLAPITGCQFDPDLVVAYGNPAQVLVMIHAANYSTGTGVKSISSGRFGCSAWIAGVPQTDACTYLVPGPGERVFAGTQDHEMSFVLPYSKIDSFVDGEIG